jgi:hypothetical protein
MEYGGPNHLSYKNTGHALVTIARTEGPSGLYRGLMPTVLTNAPFSALYYMIYTKLKVALGTWQTSSSAGSGSSGWNSTAINFVSGVCAATAATLLTQPTDVVRTRMQLGLPGTAKGNALSTLGHVLRSSGPNALLTGEPEWKHSHMPCSYHHKCTGALLLVTVQQYHMLYVSTVQQSASEWRNATLLLHIHRVHCCLCCASRLRCLLLILPLQAPRPGC